MAEQLLFGTAERIIETLGSLAAKEIGLLWGVKDELESLTNTVSTIKAVLLDAEEKRAAGNHAVTDWLGKLEDAIYDADDLLDAVSTEALRREIMTRDKKAKKVRIFFSKSNQLAFRLEMAHKIKAIRERLGAINALARDFHLKVRHVETRVGGNRETHGHVRAETVIGREGDKKAVIDRLVDSTVEDNVSILPIVAIGGLGKTTLAQLIFNDEQIQKHFQLKMWVCVSDPFHVKNIVEKILEAATKKKQETVEMDTLVGNLKEKIDGKKYFLVLDDVWNEDHRKWSELKEVLMCGARGSIILVTTRSKMVARISGTVESYSLRGLDKDASWSLFKQMAFEKGQEPEENSSIVAIGREILAKCLGVPLAIRTIGSLLRFKNSEEEWSSFKKNELSKISQNENDILQTLKLSYDHLPSHLKHCFAYCSLFPKDYVIDTSTLIRLWIAQGFVKLSNQNRCLEDVGDDYFKDLLWRSFFQEARTDEFGNVIGCKLHDLMHELAMLVAGSMINDKGRNVDEKTRHVSVVGSDFNALSITTSLCKDSSIRTFLCRPTSNNFWGELDCEAIFSSSKFLRVLDLYGRNCDFLPTSFGKLKHLRYLDLSFNRNLKKLPNSITRLQNLQTLILSCCTQLEELPKDIKTLVNLRHLEIDECDGLTYMPRGLGQLTNLQTLSNFVVHKDPLYRYSSGLRELNGLKNLRGELCIQNLRHGKDDVASECEAANLKEKQHLHGLELRWSIEGGVNDSDVNVDDEVLLEVLQPQPNLKRLRLEGNFCSRLPNWLLSLTNLVNFSLIKCTKCQYLPSLSELPSLKYLSLRSLDALEYISDSNEFSSSSALVPLFPSLNEIFFHNCPNLKGWWRCRDSSVEVNSDTNNSVEITEHPLLPSFPRLSKLTILNCPMLTSMPMFPHLEERLYLDNASWKPVQQTMMMNMAAPQSPTSTATASSSSTLSKLKSIVLNSIVQEEWLKNFTSFKSFTASSSSTPLSKLESTASSSSTPLSKLKSIVLNSIADLEILPEEWLKNLTSLKSLTIWRCDRLNSLSPGIQHLTALQDLDLYKCPELELANDEDEMQWQGLKSLLSLEFSRLPKLVSLPLGLQHVTTLQWLEISNCENLTAIPEWIHNYTSLQELRIYECSSLTSLPEGMRCLASLQRLKIKNCPILFQDGMQWQGQGLKSLLSLVFTSLPKLVSLPLGLQHATTLQRLKILNCEKLMAIPEWIHNCTSLRVLEIYGCSSLKSLPEGMRSLTSLQKLKIKDCPILLQRCDREVGEDWAKIAHIRELELQHPPQQRENSNTHASSTHPDAKVAEPAKAQKKQRIWSIFKKSRALKNS